MAKDISVTLRIIDQISQKLESIATSGDRVASRFEAFGSTANDALERATSSSHKMSEAITSATSAAENLSSAGQQASSALEQQASSADKVVDSVAEVGDSAREAGEQSREYAENTEEAAQSTLSLGDALAAAGVVEALHQMVEAYNAADDAADQFEVSLAKLSTIADPVSENMGDLSAEINTLSKDTGQNVNALAEAAYQAISASVDTKNSVEFVNKANELAIGGFTQTATAVDVLTTTLNAYQLEADQTAHIADVLINTQNLGKTSVDELAQSIGMAIPTAAAYNVNLENLSAAYAITTSSGIATAQSTTYLNTMMVELANSSSEVAQVLSETTGKNFAELMEEGKSLGDVLQILSDSVDNDSVAFSNLWQSATAGRGALSLVNAGAEKFNSTLDSMYNSAGAAGEAFEKMEGTGAHVQEMFDNAVHNFAIAWGNAQPSLDGLMSKGTDILNILSETIDKCPELAAGITSVGVALGVFTVAMGGYTIATGLATKATVALTAAMDTNPILLMVSAIAAVTVGIVAFISACEDAEYTDTRLTAASQQLSDQIEDQEKVVDDLAAKYGEHNEKTVEAKAKLEEMRAKFDATAETMGEFRKSVDETADKVAASKEEYEEASAAIQEQADRSEVLVAELMRLEKQSQLTAFQQEYERQVIEELNNMYPDLGLAYDETTGHLNKATSSLQAYCEQKRRQLQLEQDAATYMEYMEEMEENQIKLQTARENLTAATERYNEVLSELGDTEVTLGENSFGAGQLEAAASAMNSAQSEVDGLIEAIDGLQAEMDALDGSATSASDAIAGIGETTGEVSMTAEELEVAMTGVFDNVKTQAEDTAEIISNAYKEAASAVESTFTAFSSYEEDSKNTADAMASAMEENTAKMTEYSDNLKEAADLGLDKSLIEQLAGGSQEQIDTLDSLLDKIHQLGTDTEEAQQYIDDFTAKWEDFNSAKDTLESTMVAMNTTVQENMETLKKNMEEGIAKLNLDKEAGSAAKATMEAYLKQIDSVGKQCIAKAEAVAKAVQAALSASTKAASSASSSSTSTSGNTAKHADGTLFGENVYIAGENGPELIVNRLGSEVFPASETAKILDAVYANRSNEKLAPPSQEMVQTIVHKDTSTNNENRNITLTISGKGALNVSGGVTKKDLHEYISDELEGALVNILQQEMYEEGAFAYEF
ncbi:MAG: phage tail tape measure protein [Lachnospiraceae bacterium]|nr:phage tail tape measure protein [Lachnospiraceae bacterium]